MDLYCVERLADCRLAGRDRVIFEDMRVLQNLLDLEKMYIPSCNYFGTVQEEIQPYMRKVVATWMLEHWELLILSRLNWNMTAITGFDYVDHILHRVEWSNENSLIRVHAHTLVGLCYTRK
ncbi:G1/S-specific cyclin-D2 [Blattella germanica]|nr:G1/S-specific cyclin-D2 [Blattella germanica]